LSLMNAVRDVKGKLPSSHYHFEAFSPVDATGSERSFEIRLALSGRTFEVPINKSILQVLRANGVEVQSSCESGSCGTCVLNYSEGAVDHKDLCLSPDARMKQLATCVSRATSASVTLAL
jgi:phthalate 4,5-dioxygenase reductase component